MKIWCTVIRKNGTYKTVPVKAGAKDFLLDKHRYNIRGYRIGKVLGFIHVLRAFYHEGLPEPLEFNIDEEMKKAHLKIDSKGFKTILNKKILDVFGDSEFTPLEKMVIMLTVANCGISIVNLIFIFQIFNLVQVLG
jgi:hypothetical protein